MRRFFDLLVCASSAALMLGAAPMPGFTAPARAQVQMVVSAPTAPPPLPVYAQPPIPGVGYMWVPGYWAWDGEAYYWIPGYWALPPAADLYWTPGYWGWNQAASVYAFNAGYWAPTVGFYGGVNYGSGYSGEGYHGGQWRDGRFFYNKDVNNLAGAGIANVFSEPGPAAPGGAAFNGGEGGTAVRPTPAEIALARKPHLGSTPDQLRHAHDARQMPALRFDHNHEVPPIAATSAGQSPAAQAAVGAAAAQGAVNRPAPVATGRFAGSPRNFARGTPAMRQDFATHGPAMRQGFARAPVPGAVARQPFATHAPMAGALAVPPFAPRPQMQGPAFAAPRMASPGVARLGGGGFGGPAHIGGIGGAPHVPGGAPSFGGTGGAPHFGGAPHIGGAPSMGAPGVHVP